MSGGTHSRGSSLKARGAASENARTTSPQGRFALPYPLPCDDIGASSARIRGPGSSLSRLVTDGASGRVQRGDRDGREQGGDTVQERFDRAGRREVEEKAVLVLFDLGRHFEEREDQGGGLGGGQCGVGQRVGAESMGQDRGGARQQQPQGGGQEGRGRGAVAVEVPLDRLDIVCALAPRAGEFCIDPL